MKQLFLLFAFCFVFSCLGDEIRGIVKRVVDGDTVDVAPALDREDEKVRVRLYGIDAPESKQDFGTRSRQCLDGLVYMKEVRVVYKSRDQYGRIVGTIFVEDQNVNLEMVKQGMAWHYVHFAKNERQLAEAQAEAKKARRGLWSQPNPVEPWNFRKAKRQKSQTVQGSGK